MAPRREILDSEDDDSDFGGGPEAGDGEAEVGHPELTLEKAASPRVEPMGAPHNASTDSTDPSFFQHIYDQQQAAVEASEVIPDTAPAAAPASAWTEISSAPPPGQKHPAKNASSPNTSITDPAHASRRPKRSREVVPAEVIDLTDITTPRKDAASAGSADVWDVPVVSAKSQRSTRTYGKRKSPRRQQLSLKEAMPDLPPTQDPYALPEATPPPARKRTRRRSPPSSSPPQPQAQDSSPVMLVPAEVVASSDRQTRSRRGRNAAALGVASSMPDTASSLYISQSVLTASQKQEYKTVSLSSEAAPDEPVTSFPAQPPVAGEVYKSSGATTIAYPTPSRIGSSRRLPEPVDELDENRVAETFLGRDFNQPQSSPDVLTDMTSTNTSRPKRGRTKVVKSAGLVQAEVEPPPSTSTRRAKRRRVVLEEDDSWSLDPLESADGHEHLPQGGGHLGDDTGDAVGHPDVDAVDHPSAAPEVEGLDGGPTPPTSTAKSKRGRKTKGAKATQASPDVTEPPQQGEEIQESAIAPTEISEPIPASKRKRGRPRKSQTAIQSQPQAEPTVVPNDEQAAINDSQAEPAPNQPLSELSPNTQPPNTEVHPDAANDGGRGASEENAAPAVPMTTNTTTTTAVTGAAATAGSSGTAEKDAKAAGPEQKLASTAAKAGVLPQKVRYRVGLSRRSQIAPLLKSLRKPV